MLDRQFTLVKKKGYGTMILNFNTIFVGASVFMLLVIVAALIFTAPGAKRPKHNHVK